MGTKIKAIRKQKGMTQEELAEKAGLCRATIVEIENNTNKKANLRSLEKIARALGVGLDRIFFEESAQ